MNRKSILTIAVALAAVLVAGGLYASNMGFKLNYTLLGSGASASGTNTLGLPFFRQVGIDDAKQLIDDIEAGDPTRVANLSRFNPAVDGLVVYDGVVGNPFVLTAGEGYLAQMGANNVNYIIVGSHDPGFVVTLKGTSSSASGTNFYSYPYHSTAALADALINDIEQGDPTKVGNVGIFNPLTDGVTTYDGVTGTAFSLTPGAAYFIQASSATDIPYVPSHY